MNQYRYKPLDEARLEIRYLVLLPGSREAPVKALLATAPLAEDNHASFEALSYTWGSPIDPMTIAIQTAELASTESPVSYVENNIAAISSKPFGTVSITQNLGHALPYFRYRDRPRVMWIDAICINQQDIGERSRQVQRMADVYTMASRVVVWLGEGDLRHAMDVLDLISSKVHYDCSSRVLNLVSPDDVDAHWADTSREVSLKYDAYHSLHELVQRQWFSRLWILQEILLANSDSVLMVGNHYILWQDFCHALHAIVHKGVIVDEPPSAGSLANFWEYVEKAQCIALISAAFKQDLTFNRLLESTRDSQCTEPRDRVFALLSMVSKAELEIIPDYTTSIEDVFQTTAASYFSTSCCLDLLSRCELNPARRAMPSWVPDLGIPRASFPYGLMSYSFSSNDTVLVEDNILKLKGIRVATIERMLVCHSTYYSTATEMAIEISRLMRGVDLSSKDRSGGNMSDTMARVMKANLFAERYYPPTTGFASDKAIDSFSSVISAIQDNKKWELSGEFEKYCLQTNTSLTGRGLFFTTEGYVGVCPSFAQIGDIIVSIVGCPAVLTLRPQAQDRYLLVGEAYCHGVMNGEAFLGPLPTHVEHVENRDSGLPAFLNRSTAQLQADDPRLDHLPLPPPWEKVEHSASREHFYFRNEETGEQYETCEFDPRTTSVELTKRGIELRDFNIV